ncbi:MAG TPA: CBS domain-containing protein, partial [Acidobacteriota bacterium]|nr:CBS domain-containing protein [Acidobacteriota bacterium]
MKVIATHINADFDGFAAMIGLLKMHPDAMLVFPGAKEPGLRQFLKETPMDVPEIAVKEVKETTHLILVDAGREDRLGALTGALQQTPRPFIEIYDHHPERQITISADRYHVHRYGSTTTIVGLEMMEMSAEGKAPVLSSLEASVMLAGIYEDTANFLSTGTTGEDLRVALFLLDRGAEINVVNRILTHRLRPDQVDFFNTMVSHCESSNLEGRVVVISAFSWPVFVPEAAYLVHRLMDLEPIDIFFALIQMENRVHVIARSLAPDVDVGRVAEELGGGGHAMAASAVLKGMTLIEARENLLSVLHQNLQRREKASDLMKPNVITIDPTKKLSDAAELMNRHRINTLAVAEQNRIVGTITRQVVDGAVFHGLQDRLVQEYMGTDIPLVDPDTSARDVFERMISGRNRFVLVGHDPASVDGIITRMDLLRLHYESMF